MREQPYRWAFPALVAGLVAVSFLLLRRVRHRLRREMVRVVIDHAPAA